MANVLAFDTLASARRLKEAGVATAQAEAHAEAVRDAVTEGVATKADIAGVENEVVGVKTEVAGVKTEVAHLKTEVVGVKADVADVKKDVSRLDGRLGRLEEKVETRAGKADLFKVALGVVVAQTTLTVALTVALIELIGGAP